jgi:hypothetical protein
VSYPGGGICGGIVDPGNEKLGCCMQPSQGFDLRKKPRSRLTMDLGGRYDTQCPCSINRLSAVVDTEFAVDIARVRLDCMH